jgi:hypothetical protein
MTQFLDFFPRIFLRYLLVTSRENKTLFLQKYYIIKNFKNIQKETMDYPSNYDKCSRFAYFFSFN